MARVNIDILGISKLKWTGMSEFNSDDHYIYYCGQESLRRNGVALIVNIESKMQYLDAISKTTECGEGNGNPLQYSCLENSMDREAW